MLGKEEEAAANSGSGEVRGAGGETLCLPTLGRSCPRMAALKHSQDVPVNRRGSLDVKIRLGMQRAAVSWCHCRRVAALQQGPRRRDPVHALPSEDPTASCRCCKGGQLCCTSSQCLSLPVLKGLPPHRTVLREHSGLTLTKGLRRTVWKWKGSSSAKTKLSCSLAVLLCWD